MTKQDMARALVGAELFDSLVRRCGLASALRAAEVRLEQMTQERDEAVHACAAALAERITWYQRGREEALKKP